MQSPPAKRRYPKMRPLFWPWGCGEASIPYPFAEPASPHSLLLANLPAPRPEHLDHLGRDGRRQRDTEEDEALVNGVCERKLRGQA
jgi:hypothetical protein